MTWSWHTVVRRAGYGTAAAGVLAAALAGSGDPGPLIVGSGAVAVVAGLFPVLWAPGRVGAVGPSVLAACAVSLLVTAGYRGPASGGIELWWLLEAVALLVPVVPAVRRLSPAAAFGHGTLLVAAVALLPLRIALWAEPPAPPVVTVKLCLGSALLACVVVGVGRYLRSMDTRARAAVVAERRAQRLDLARDLHDFAAHDVTGVVVLAQAAQVLAQKDPGRVVELLAGIEAAGRQALVTMDRTVQVFTADDADPEPRGSGAVATADRGAGRAAAGGAGARSLRRDLSELPALAERFTRSGSARVRLEAPAEAELAAVPAAISGLGYRLVVEALTNVRRHAPGAREVAIEVGPDRCGGRPALRVTVTDDGAPDGAGGSGGADGGVGGAGGTGGAGGVGVGLGGAEREGGGFGLAGLRERVEAAGGELTVGPGPEGGWRVDAVLPTEGVAGLGG
ncbi:MULTISPECIES: sensor histidine kinase [Streptomycetaceae]|uniref:sensor histidine kinase n=1 Tax=Streptomycetaceae TaxID=2062 RepID=UPI000B0FA99F|nr:histidine kinase [Streptomyces sp. CB02056]